MSDSDSSSDDKKKMDDKKGNNSEDSSDEEEPDRDMMVQKILSKQLKHTPPNIKLMFKDVKRICKNINGDIFSEQDCCLWNGKITNNNNKDKGKYVNFYFNGKKRALHRLLYSNFVGCLVDDEYLKFTCKNKGTCCTLAHFEKLKNKDDEKQMLKRQSEKGKSPALLSRIIKKKSVKKSKSVDDLIIERSTGKYDKFVIKFD